MSSTWIVTVTFDKFPLQFHRSILLRCHFTWKNNEEYIKAHIAIKIIYNVFILCFVQFEMVRVVHKLFHSFRLSDGLQICLNAFEIYK